MTTLFSGRIIPAISWMLIHSLWQGLLFAIITGFILILTKRSSTSFRYNLVFVQFLLFLSTAAFTFFYELDRGSAYSMLHLAAPGMEATGIPRIFDAQAFFRTCGNYLTNNAPLIVMIWCIVFITRSVRMISGLVYLQRISSRELFAPDEHWKDRLAVLSQKLQLKRTVSLFESAYIKVPVVIGNLKPVILMPLGLMTGLPAAQVEAVLLHELAHVRRNDQFVNLLQHCAEAIFFFNPSLLWISSLLREEREHCCDDIAIRETSDKKGFIQALISFKEHALYGSAAYANAFPAKKGHLLRRITRIVHNRNKSLNVPEGIFLIGSIILFSVMVATAAMPAYQAAQQVIQEDTSILGPSRQQQEQEKIEEAKAEKARAQAELEREQADKAMILHERERLKHEKEREQADKAMILHERERLKHEKEREQAEAARIRTEKAASANP